MNTENLLFKCPRWGYTDKNFQEVCPECGRPYLRDYIDTQMHPGDPNPAGIDSGRFRARAFLIPPLTGIMLYLLFSFGVWEISVHCRPNDELS